MDVIDRRIKDEDLDQLSELDALRAVKCFQNFMGTAKKHPRAVRRLIERLARETTYPVSYGAMYAVGIIYGILITREVGWWAAILAAKEMDVVKGNLPLHEFMGKRRKYCR